MASHVLFLVSALCISSVSAAVFVSIDCGSSDTSTYDNSIFWTGDDSYMQNGESYTVQSKSISPVMDTLRVFATRKKNCYSINEFNKGDRVLVRASFYYGNYDKKSSPPSFDLQFDGNHWATVVTSSTISVYYEVTYVVKGDSLSVCVAQTKPDQFPFISALEVRSLLSTMYEHVDQNYPLHLRQRIAYGAKGTIRYTDDPYDRIWSPVVVPSGLTSVESDVLSFQKSARDEPPPAVLQNAVTALSPTGTIQFAPGFPSFEIPVYFNMYFSEVTQLDSTQKRSFQIVMNNEPLLDVPIIPPYGNCTEITSRNSTVSSSTTIALVPTSDSTLPPLINAVELFWIGDVMTDGTNRKDVDGLASLQEAFDVLLDWSGDPCLPAPYSWDWIDCSSDPTPRVTALYLSSFDLSGPLPDFSSMDALQTIDFQNNSLYGPIPDYLAKLPNLKQLNLGSNQFSGPIPDSLSKKKGLNLVVTGNPDLCTSGNSCKTTTTTTTTTARSPGLSSSGSAAKKKNSKLPLILGTTIPAFIIVWAVVGVFAVVHYRRKAAAVATSGGVGEPGATGATPLNPRSIGKMDEAMMHGVKKNMEEQGDVELADQRNHQRSGNSSPS